MIKQQYETGIKEKYLNTEELRVLKSIQDEQNKFFNPIDYYTLNISEEFI